MPATSPPSPPISAPAMSPDMKRAAGQLESKDERADVHQLAVEPGRVSRDDSEDLAEHRAREPEQHALHHEAGEHIEAAEAEHAQHADFAGAPRHRRIHRVHRAEDRSDREDQRHREPERAQLLDEAGLLRVELGLGHRVDLHPRIGGERFEEVVLHAGAQDHVQHREAARHMDVLRQHVEVGEDFRFARAVIIGKDPDDFESAAPEFEIAANRSGTG